MQQAREQVSREQESTDGECQLREPNSNRDPHGRRDGPNESDSLISQIQAPYEEIPIPGDHEHDESREGHDQ